MAKLHFRYGTMSSAKTALALMHVYNFEEKGNKALLVKPATDTRTQEVWSRVGIKQAAITTESMMQMTLDELAKYNVVVIDECQFMTTEQVDFLCQIVDDLDIPVFCYGLRTDFLGHLFEGSKRLFEVADEIEEIKTSCWCGQSAKFNARVENGKILREAPEGGVIDIENQTGTPKYMSLCRKHYMSGEFEPPKD